jgi:uncharacterized Zn finger protein (UPF0148 family)
MHSQNSFKDKQIKYTTYINNNKNSVSTTLDIKHQEKVKEFELYDEQLKKKNNQYKKYLKQLDELNNIKSSDLTLEINQKKATLKDDIESIKFDIDKLKNRTDEINYYEDTIDILLEYYNANNPNLYQVQAPIPISTIIDINDIFKKKQNVNSSTDKSKLYDKYMKVVHNTNTKKIKNTFTVKNCPKCKVEKTVHLGDGLVICNQCGDTDTILLETDKPNYKEAVIETKVCAYKRSNHLSEILNQLQAKESTEIDEDIYSMIKEELKIQRIANYKLLDHKIMKKILKKLKLNKYYEHIHHIINNLNNLPPPSMTREQEENIKKTFKDIQKPFQIYRPKKRKNFLNYNYILHKICELYEYDDFLPYFPLLKSRTNLEEQDIVWEKICKYNNYQFIPSI